MSGDFNEAQPSPSEKANAPAVESTPPPSWAIRSVEVPPPAHGPHTRKARRSAWLFPALGAGALSLLIGGVSFYVGRSTGSAAPPTTDSVAAVTGGEGASLAESGSSTPATTTPPTTASAVTASAPSPTSTTPTTTTPPQSTTTVAPTTTTTEAVTATTSGIFSPDDTRRAVFKGGVVYLGGEVPSQEVADLIASRVAAVVGPGNVVVEYTINPAAPVPDSAPLFVADLVLFARGTATITDPFIPLLDLGTRLFEVNPNVTVEVIAHTDSESSAQFNQGLSERRANAVKQYWVDAGVEPARISAVGKGESEPIASNNTAEGRQLNRRAEFIISGIIG